MRHRHLPAVAAAGAVLMFGANPAFAAEYADGSTGGPDPYFPSAGNGGYDALHYDLTLRYDNATRVLTGTADITVKTTQALTSLSFDLRDPNVSAVRVDGVPAEFTKIAPGQIEDPDPLVTRYRSVGGEVIIKLPTPVRRHKTVTVSIAYGGTLTQPRDNTWELYGFVPFADGAVVTSEADGAATWFPVNDITTDKATFEFHVTAPAGKVVAANGLLESQVTGADGWTTWNWNASDPMTPYLATASIGDYDITRGTMRDGTPIINFVDRDITPAQKATTATALARQPEILEYLASVFGPYPFESSGAIVDDNSVGYALETQTRPVYYQTPGALVHELAHQWYGDSVSPTRWADIWLNESFATYATWLWNEHTGVRTVQTQFNTSFATGATSSLWRIRTADPGAENLFAQATYTKGAMALQALRVKIGDKDFFQLLRRWHSQSRHADGSTAEFEALASKLAHQDLTNFFNIWIHSTTKPVAGSW